MSDRKWVCDASPIILLAKVGRADLLLSLSDALMVPAAVEQEVDAGPPKSPARRWLQDNRDRYVVHAVAPVPSVASWELGDGETAALSWVAQDNGWTVILDDRAGRRCGRALDLSLTGTLGLLLLAKEEAYLSEIKPALNALMNAGLQASDSLLEDVLRRAGELE